MEPTIPVEGQENITPAADQQATLEKSNTQVRIDELTAARTAAEKRAEEAAAQVSQLTALVAQQLQERQVVTKPAEPAIEIPEGVDPALAKFFTAQLEKIQKSNEEKSAQMFWQIQNQVNQQNVQSQYAGLPPEVLADAAARLTTLKRQYGENVSMDDAVGVAHFQWLKKQGKVAQAQQFNQMSQPLNIQGSQPPAPKSSTNLASPASHPDWDKWDNETQNKYITQWEKGGGHLFGD